MVDQVQLYGEFIVWTGILFTNRVFSDVLSAALDSGVAVSILVIFFCLQFPKNGTVRVISSNLKFIEPECLNIL